ncbi:MAG: DeoR/GlpR family DNA-binding transcription regulator [Selenomonadaceae bacterium]|nr:DeoR/GlpR family DNA-binding transcription regulator [Selenomonadaceae bacterium]
MLPEERQKMIVQLVNEHGSVSVKELSARFALTEDSIRKDLTLLQKNGLLKKTYGGALKLMPDEDHFVSQRKPKYRAEKQRIAKKALQLLHDGETIFLDISTTNIELAKFLKTSGLSLTVVTNMVDVMTTMAGDEHNRLIFIGGTFSEGCDGFVGALTNRELAHYHFDRAFLGVVGLDLARQQATTYTPEDATTKEAILSASAESWLLLETRKLRKAGPHVFSDLRDVTGVLTEKELDEETAARLAALGITCQ